MARKHVSYRFGEECCDLIARLKEKHGVSETALIEMAIRRMALVDLATGRWPAATVLDAAASLLDKKPK